MLNTSTQYQQALYEDHREFLSKASIELEDGTILDLSSAEIMQGGIKIVDGVSGNGSFDIGSAIINKLTLNINNIYDTYSTYNFTNAIISVFIGLKLQDHIEWLKKGVYIADDPTCVSGIITLEALDYMSKFDRLFNNNITYPATLQTIINSCCSQCGVILASGHFDHYDYVVEKNPFDDNDSITCRELISYCAQIAGCFARCNTDGKLELKWYDTFVFRNLENNDGGFLNNYLTGVNIDGGNFIDYETGANADSGSFTNALTYHHIYSLSSLKIATDDVVITGIRVTSADSKEEGKDTLKGETVLYGNSGYILEIGSNPLIEFGKADVIANYLGTKIIGMKFRPLEASVLGNPAMEAGDSIIVTDRNQNSYCSYITNLSYTSGGYENLKCDAQSPARQSSERLTAVTKAIIEAQKNAQIQLSRYDNYARQLNSLAMNAMGFYETTRIQDDGSTIKYLHDKPLLADSLVIYKKSIDGFFLSKDGGQTYINGFDNNGNAVLNILAAIGIESDWIDTRGLTASDENGNITFEVDAATGKIRIVADSFVLRGKTIPELAYTEAEKAVGNLDTFLNTAEIFKRLTNNGAIQGIYMKNGNLYINASYIMSGTLTLGGNGNTNGSLRLLSADGSTEYAHMDNRGLIAYKGNIGNWVFDNNAIYNNLWPTGERDNKSTGMGTWNTDWAFWAGDGKFRVTQNGKLFCYDIAVNGNKFGDDCKCTIVNDSGDYTTYLYGSGLQVHHSPRSGEYVSMNTTGVSAHNGSNWSQMHATYFLVQDSGGSFTKYTSSGQIVSSQECLKTNITEETALLDEVRNTNVYSFNYLTDIDKEDPDNTMRKKKYGFVIGEQYALTDKIIAGNGQGIDSYNAVGVLWGGVKELTEKVDLLENRISELETILQTYIGGEKNGN
ncbi:hypothetical protein KTH81_18095 [Lachnospiraceae bacterium ASD3451]|uniref:hypothetical protein n=1 Tax=Diplocloster agilis TaxID=2850323 RepID=UPI001DF80287|nr:hypothetical protein [Diplocloster agilis]MBU9745739.1 hypothetical protein [Diplocloster agilis]